jgi:putative membrane protein
LVGFRLAANSLWAPRVGDPEDHFEPNDIDQGNSELPLYLTGVLVLWIAADWPIGPLGAGYLLSVHTLQYVLFAFVAPPLLISGTPRWLLRRMIRPRWAFRIARFVSKPLIAFLIFNVVLLATHLPSVVDGLTSSQLGSFAVDMSWLLAGLVFWMPILGPFPDPAAFLTYARYPIYALYELAPPMSRLTVVEDQQIAGMIMKIVGGFIVLGTASVLFFKWAKAEES